MKTTFVKVNSVIYFVLLAISFRANEGIHLNHQTTTKSCSDPGTPEHAFREDEFVVFYPGQEVIFTCEYTYRLVGSQRRTCLPNGTWTGIQPKCEVYMCDELDAIEPDNGWKVGNNYSIGSNITYECSENYKLTGDQVLQCLPSGQWSAQPPTCEHLCKHRKCTAAGEMCQAKSGKIKCKCRSNMDCTSLVNRVCGSDGVTYINDCIMNATGCRNNKKIQKVKDGHCVPGEICSIVPISYCRASFHVFFYNATKGTCEEILAGGCHPSGWNGFWSEKECERHCAQDICILQPEHGPCTDNLQRWYFEPSINECQQFRYGGCFGSANNFVTKDDCLKRCGGRINFNIAQKT